jgi:alpha-mannosidase
MTDGGERCKLLGIPMEYRFALMPISPGTANLDMLKAADGIAVAPMVKYIAHDGEAKRSLGIIKVESASVAVSVVKRPENEEEGVVVIRMFNPSDKPAMAKVSTPYTLLSARGTDPCENRDWNEPLTGNTLECILQPWKIRTYKLKLKFTK